MKKIKKSSLSELPIDVAEYMFTEWLVRQGLFSAYKANCEKFSTCHRTFREDLRSHIRSVHRSPRFAFDDFIAISFPFSLTPEGYDFWLKRSAIWRRFCSDFKSEF
jgi:hypothetical protein